MEDNNSARSYTSNNATYRDVNPFVHASNEKFQQEYQRRNSGSGVYLELTTMNDRQQGSEKEKVTMNSNAPVGESDDDRRSWEHSGSLNDNQICTPSYRRDYRKLPFLPTYLLLYALLQIRRYSRQISELF